MDEYRQPSRRAFVKQAAMVAAGAPLLSNALSYPTSSLQVHVFSKHLQFLNYTEMAAAAADIGFDGVDLSVRPGGHVEPKEVATQLPQAVESIRQKGLLSTMMVTGINHLHDPVNQKVLETAASSGIKFYRMGWYRYPDNTPLPEALQTFQHQMSALADLNQKLGLTGAYQNHAGNYVGASIWEIWQLLQHTSDKTMGCQYDIRHAVVEGGLSWQNGLRLIHSRIHTIVAKDFVWEKTPKGWNLKNVPLGEGMVDFKTYFGLLKKYNIEVPVSLHFEYDLGGAEHGDRQVNTQTQQLVFTAMRQDLERLKKYWQEA